MTDNKEAEISKYKMSNMSKQIEMEDLFALVATEAHVRLGRVSRDDFNTHYNQMKEHYTTSYRFNEFDKKEYNEYLNSENKKDWIEKQVQSMVVVEQAFEAMKNHNR